MCGNDLSTEMCTSAQISQLDVFYELCDCVGTVSGLVDGMLGDRVWLMYGVCVNVRMCNDVRKCGCNPLP